MVIVGRLVTYGMLLNYKNTSQLLTLDNLPNLSLNLCLPESSVDNHCKQFGTRSSQT